MASTSSTRQATAARRRATPKPVTGAAAVASAFEPVRIAADEDVVEESEPLFYIGEVEYSIPKNIPVGVALEYMRIAGQIGEELAAPPLLIRVLGEEGYTALEQSKGLNKEQMERIVDHVVDRALGRSEAGGKAKP